jgi:hypothetical protein
MFPAFLFCLIIQPPLKLVNCLRIKTTIKETVGEEPIKIC